MKYLWCVSLLFFAVKSYSWDGTVTGKISKVDVTGAENYGFRIVFDGAPELCGNSRTWAYLNGSASNYSTFVSVLVAAKMAQSNVTIYTNQRGSEGYCEIGYISVR